MAAKRGGVFNFEKVKGFERCYDYGNGIYFFQADQEPFPEKLARFLDERPELEVVTLSTGAVNGCYDQGDKGVLVVFRAKDKRNYPVMP